MDAEAIGGNRWRESTNSLRALKRSRGTIDLKLKYPKELSK
jgi:hypothetical protein